ncbi:hypothetical protein FS837_008052 [Tulasnella sp. UAMH 9824]|nr:hypothetical protein FS837_008052 [Tulasnella sp. UAMH 9824]
MPYATKMNDMAVILALATGELPSETEDLPIDDLELKRLLSKCWSPQPNERPSAVYCLGILNSTFLVSHANHGMESTIGQQVLQTEQLRAGGLRRQNALPRGHKLPSTLLSAPVDGNLLSDGGLAANGDGAGFGGSKVAGAAEVLVNPSITPEDVQSFVTSKEYNPSKFDTKPASARYFVIKSYTEDEVFKSLKHEMWTSTEPGNKRLDKAFKENNGHGPIYLFFSVNASGHFCGVAEMLTPVDYTSSIPWAQSKWKGVIKVNWIFVRDIPNSVLRHIRLTNTQERKPVTNSRDTQELPPEAGQEMLRIFLTHPSRTSILQDFAYYENLANNRPMGYQQAGTAPQQDYPMPARQAHSAMGGDFASANKTLTPFIRPQQDARQDTPPMQSTGAMNFGWIASTPTNRIS